MSTEVLEVEESIPIQNSLTAKGFFELEIVNPDGSIAGKSERVQNLVTRLGFQHICLRVGTALTGTAFSHLNVGEGAAPATNATSLPTEVSGTNGAVQRVVATASTEAGSVTLRFLGTMASAASFVTATENISNVGIFNHSSAASCVAGAAYASSSVATNQAVNILKKWCHLLVTASSKLRKFGEHLIETIPSQAASTSTYGLACGRV